MSSLICNCWPELPCILVFDRDFRYLTGGFRRVSALASESGANLETDAEGIFHEHLHFDDGIVIQEAGYVYIYLSNENETPVEVFFDDFKVEHVKGPVVQLDDYYPFGLTFNSYKRENSVENKIRFQGQEHIDDLGLGWDSFKWRNHQPDIGRFFNVDPIAEKYYYNSPYAFSENKVVAHVELEGLEAFGLRGAWEDKVIIAFKSGVETTGKALSDGVKYVGEKIVDGSKAVTNWVSNNQDKTKPEATKGVTLTITNEGPAGPNGSHLPKAADQSQNGHLPQSVVDALGALAKGGPPGSRASNPEPMNPGGQPAPTLPVGEAINGTTAAAVPGGQAAQAVFTNSSSSNSNTSNSGSSNTQEPWTRDSITVQYGKDSTYKIPPPTITR